MCLVYKGGSFGSSSCASISLRATAVPHHLQSLSRLAGVVVYAADLQPQRAQAVTELTQHRHTWAPKGDGGYAKGDAGLLSGDAGAEAAAGLLGVSAGWAASGIASGTCRLAPARLERLAGGMAEIAGPMLAALSGSVLCAGLCAGCETGSSSVEAVRTAASLGPSDRALLSRADLARTGDAFGLSVSSSGRPARQQSRISA